MNARFHQAAARGEVVVLAGAGVSMVKPSALPGWKPLNTLIAEVLRARLENALGREKLLELPMDELDFSRHADRFPPDYQAQIIHEMCGRDYFRALQSLDVDVTNAAHEALASLAQSGKLTAIVTTNFDRLIEIALAQRGVSFEAVYDDAGFESLAQRFASGEKVPLPIIKIHGSVCDPDSMIDTLKQRRLKRAPALGKCLKFLHAAYWLYLGFSAADLEDNPNYLGLVEGAATSAGATFVARSAGLGMGARVLTNAYGANKDIVVADLPAFLTPCCDELGADVPAYAPDEPELGPPLVKEKLAAWADTLSVSATGLCLAAMLEANGQAEVAARLLDRLVRSELRDERQTADFERVQLHYGRLGAAWGRFAGTRDLWGNQSNADVESLQSLLRLAGTKREFAANGWLPVALLWRGDGAEATRHAVDILVAIESNQWPGAAPSCEEEAVDAWIAAAQVCIVNTGEPTVQLVHGTAALALERAQGSGDVVRAARVAALHLLALSETREDVPTLAHLYDAEFAAAARVGDGFAQGLRLLALGRWLVGVGGQTLAQNTDPALVAWRALEDFKQAEGFFERQVIDPWITFARVQKAKAHADFGEFDQAVACLHLAENDLDRFPIWKSHLLESLAQIQQCCGDERAEATLQDAIQAAHESGLFARRESLLLVLPRYAEPMT